MFSFIHVDPDPGYWYSIWKVNSKNRDWIWKTHSVLHGSGVGDFMGTVSVFMELGGAVRGGDGRGGFNFIIWGDHKGENQLLRREMIPVNTMQNYASKINTFIPFNSDDSTRIQYTLRQMNVKSLFGALIVPNSSYALHVLETH